jgi:hypothetical protein
MFGNRQRLLRFSLFLRVGVYGVDFNLAEGSVLMAVVHGPFGRCGLGPRSFCWEIRGGALLLHIPYLADLSHCVAQGVSLLWFPCFHLTRTDVRV